MIDTQIQEQAKENIKIQFHRNGDDYLCTAYRLRDVNKTVEEDGQDFIDQLQQQYPDALPDSFVIVGEVYPDAEEELTLEQAKANAKTELKTYRQQVEASGFMLNGQRWDSEQKDELRLNSAYKLFDAGLTEYPGWKIADGVYVTLTPELLEAATLGLMQHYGHAFAVEAEKIAEIEMQESVEAVENWLENEMQQGWGQTCSQASGQQEN